VKKQDQDEEGTKVRNDRLVAVEQGEQQLYSRVNAIRDLPQELIQQIGKFFVSYHRLRGRRFRVLGTQGPDVAHRLLEQQRIA
jgi:inorganic pyrophosphatase